MKTVRYILVFLLAGLFTWVIGSNAEARELKRKPQRIVYLDQGVEYDSNVVTNTDQANTGSSDVLFPTNVLVDFSLLPKDKVEQDLRVSFMFLQILHNDLSNLDFRYLAPNAKYWWLANPDWAFDVQGGYVYTQEDDNEFYAGGTAEANVYHVLTEKATLSLGYKFANQDYDPTALNGRDALRHTVELKLKHDCSEHIVSVLKGRFEVNDADDDGYSFLGEEIEAAMQVNEWPGDFDWEFALGYRHRGYDGVYPGEAEDRNDNRLTVSAEVSHPIYKEIVFLSGQVRYIDNFSNLGPFDYDEVIVGGHIYAVF